MQHLQTSKLCEVRSRGPYVIPTSSYFIVINLALSSKGHYRQFFISVFQNYMNYLNSK